MEASARLSRHSFLPFGLGTGPYDNVYTFLLVCLPAPLQAACPGGRGACLRREAVAAIRLGQLHPLRREGRRAAGGHLEGAALGERALAEPRVVRRVHAGQAVYGAVVVAHDLHGQSGGYTSALSDRARRAWDALESGEAAPSPDPSPKNRIKPTARDLPGARTWSSSVHCPGWIRGKLVPLSSVKAAR